MKLWLLLVFWGVGLTAYAQDKQETRNELNLHWSCVYAFGGIIENPDLSSVFPVGLSYTRYREKTAWQIALNTGFSSFDGAYAGYYKPHFVHWYQGEFNRLTRLSQYRGMSLRLAYGLVFRNGYTRFVNGGFVRGSCIAYTVSDVSIGARLAVNFRVRLSRHWSLQASQAFSAVQSVYNNFEGGQYLSEIPKYYRTPFFQTETRLGLGINF